VSLPSKIDQISDEENDKSSNGHDDGSCSR
jgi:hypothetical protein